MQAYYKDNNITILHGDCMETLKTIPDCTVNTCVTSPPFLGLRDYGTGIWAGGDPECKHLRLSKTSADNITGHKHSIEMRGSGDDIQRSFCKFCGAVRIDKQIGLEASPQEYVDKLVRVFREVKRILKDDGTLWLNLGDSYASFIGEDSVGYSDVGIKNKDLLGIPWMVAFALRNDGWWLRQDIIWEKPNSMPESVKDRCTKSHEYIFLLSKSNRYYFDQEAIKEPSSGEDVQYYNRNKRSVWRVNTKPYKGAHFATFPQELITPCILAGCPDGGIVLDPFGGSGTTGEVARNNGRNAILCELNEDYIKLQIDRFKQGLLF